MKNFSFLIKVLFIITLLASSLAVKADEWRGWRGLEKQATSDSTPVATEWSVTKNILWKTEIPGEGYSSPVVNEKHVFLTAAEISRTNMNLSFAVVIILTLGAIFIILKNTWYILKKKPYSPGNQITPMLLLCTNGLLLFSFLILFWMFIGERTLHKVFINYLFSGAVIILTILLAGYRIKRTSVLTVGTAILIPVLVYMLVMNRPRPDYFGLKEFISKANLWLVPVSASSLFIPLLASVYLLFSFILGKIQNGKNSNEATGKEKKLFSSKFFLTSSFILGAVGFFSIPAITFLKLYVVDADGLRIRTTVTPSLFIDPEYAFPFFLGFLCLGFLFWATLFTRSDIKTGALKFSHFLFLLPITVFFFILLNYSKTVPEYQRIVYCIERQTGKVIWKEAFLSGPAIKISNYNSQASPTPLIDNKGIHAYFGSAGLVSVDFNGKLIWENKDLPFDGNHGAGSSPVFCDDRIIILNSMSEGSYITSIDAASGKPVWKKDLPVALLGEYRPPAIYKDYILEWSSVRKELILYKEDTGEIDFSVFTDWERSGEAVTTPVITSDTVILADVGTAAAADLNKLQKKEDPFIWKTSLGTSGPETSSPVYANGLIFMISDFGFASCLNIKTGEIMWQKRLRGSFLSSPVISNNKVYFSNNAGVTTVIECAPVFKLIAENDLQEGIYATPAPVDGQLFIRTKNTLWCIKEQ